MSWRLPLAGILALSLIVLQIPTSTADEGALAVASGAPVRFSGDIRLEAAEGLANFILSEDVTLPAPTDPAASLGLRGALQGMPATDLTLPAGTRLAAPVNLARIASAAPVAEADRIWQDANVQLNLLLQDLSLAPDLAAASGSIEARAAKATLDAVLGNLVADGPLGLVGSGVSGVSLGRVSWPVEDLRIYARDVRIDVRGRGEFPWATGRLEGPGGEREFVNDQLLLGGEYTLRTLALRVSGASTIDWLGAGRFDLVSGPVAAASGTHGATVAAVALGAAAATGAGWVGWRSLRRFAPGLLVPLYARLPRDRLLDHSGRETVFELVRQEPGVSTQRLAGRVEFGWSTLAYHLRVLEREDLIVSIRDGRHRRYFDRESGKYANGKKQLVALLRNDTSLALAKAVAEKPGITQKELSERLQLSPSSVHWHVQRLSGSELLEARRVGHYVRYHPGRAWSEVDLADFSAGAARMAMP